MKPIPCTKHQRQTNMRRALDAWQSQLSAHDFGCLELHFTGDTVKGVLRVTLGTVKVKGEELQARYE